MDCREPSEATVAKLHALFVIGTRPEAIKLAPVIAECRRRPDEVSLTVCFTGQHQELVQPVADYFGIHADIDLALMQPGQSLARLTGRMLDELDGVFLRTRPNCVVAQGDTTTVLCATLAAFYQRIPLVHVEAGLRSGNLMLDNTQLALLHAPRYRNAGREGGLPD